jgi:hypothetical protein
MGHHASPRPTASGTQDPVISGATGSPDGKALDGSMAGSMAGSMTGSGKGGHQ